MKEDHLELLEDNMYEYGTEDSDDENAEVNVDLDIKECEAAVRGAAMFQDTKVVLKGDGRLLLDDIVQLTFTTAQMKKARDAGVLKCDLHIDTFGYIWGSGHYGMLLLQHIILTLIMKNSLLLDVPFQRQTMLWLIGIIS